MATGWKSRHARSISGILTRVKICLLYFDDCPNWQVADSRLAEALTLVGLPEQIVERILVTTDEEAQSAHFIGSPTILIDGEDPFASGDAGSYGLTCRVYRTGDGLAGSPTVDELVAVLNERA